MPDLDAHNDMGVDSQETHFRGARRTFLMLLASLQFLPRRSAGRADPRRTRWTGATPLFLALVRARGGRCFHNSAPPPRGVAPVQKYPLREGGRAEPKAGGIAAAGFRLAPQDASVLKQIRAGA